MASDRSEDDTSGMASDPAELDPFQSELAWRAGALAGVVGALVMGVTMMVTRLDILREGAVVSSLLTVAH